MKGRPRLIWIDGVKLALGRRGITVGLHDNTREIGRSVEPWCICRQGNFSFDPVFFRTTLQRSGCLSPGKVWDAVSRCGWGNCFKKEQLLISR